MSKISPISLADESLIDLVKAMTEDQKVLAVQFLDTKLLKKELAIREEGLNNKFNDLYTVLNDFEGKEHTIENLDEFFTNIANVLKGKKKKEEKSIVEGIIDKADLLPPPVINAVPLHIDVEEEKEE